jgi:hypothetical protein
MTQKQLYKYNHEQVAAGLGIKPITLTNNTLYYLTKLGGEKNGRGKKAVYIFPKPLFYTPKTLIVNIFNFQSARPGVLDKYLEFIHLRPEGFSMSDKQVAGELNLYENHIFQVRRELEDKGFLLPIKQEECDYQLTKDYTAAFKDKKWGPATIREWKTFWRVYYEMRNNYIKEKIDDKVYYFEGVGIGNIEEQKEEQIKCLARQEAYAVLGYAVRRVYKRETYGFHFLSLLETWAAARMEGVDGLAAS